MSDLLIENKNGVGTITLNRPQALNAINLDMVRGMYTTLKQWEHDDNVKVVVVKGAGEKAFCAGGDIRTVYEYLKANNPEYLTFFAEEFELNEYIYTYPKPYIALMTGYVMGGGMGISQGASFRIVTEKSKISMPEVGIGYFPDVGGSYFLARCPRALGLYLGITGVIASGEDTMYANLANWILSDDQVTSFLQGLEQLFIPAQHTAVESTQTVLTNYLLSLGARQRSSHSTLQQVEPMIEKHFTHTTVAAIVSSLEGETDTQYAQWVEKTLEKMRKQSPLSMVTTQRLVQLGKSKSLSECFVMEYALLKEWMLHGDFLEGVRALLIDKDQQPKWRYALSQITPEIIERLFVNVAK